MKHFAGPECPSAVGRKPSTAAPLALCRFRCYKRFTDYKRSGMSVSWIFYGWRTSNQ